MMDRPEVVQRPGPRVCESCQIWAAEVLCTCTGPRVYLCGHCIAKHATVQYYGLMHQFVRADIEISDLDAFGQRSRAFAAGTVELRDNLTRIDLCCREVSGAFDAVIESLAQWREFYVGELQMWKVTLSAEIEEAENEVRSTLAQHEVALKGKYSEALRYFSPGSLVLFSYQIDTSGLECWAQSVVKLQYAEVNKEPLSRPGHSEALVYLKKDEISLYNFESADFSAPVRLSRALAFDSNSKCTLVDGGQVFCCGYEIAKQSKAAYLVHIASGAVEDLPPLGVARSGPGLLSHYDAVFVFGTYSQRYAGTEGPGKSK